VVAGRSNRHSFSTVTGFSAAAKPGPPGKADTRPQTTSFRNPFTGSPPACHPVNLGHGCLQSKLRVDLFGSRRLIMTSQPSGSLLRATLFTYRAGSQDMSRTPTWSRL